MCKVEYLVFQTSLFEVKCRNEIMQMCGRWTIYLWHNGQYIYINPLTADPVKALHFAIVVLASIFNF